MLHLRDLVNHHLDLPLVARKHTLRIQRVGLAPAAGLLRQHRVKLSILLRENLV